MKSFIIFFFSFLQVAVAFTNTCPLNKAVFLEYDEITGKFSVVAEEKDDGGDTATEEQVRQLKRVKEKTVRIAGSEHKRYLRARREEAKSIYMARSCPCGGDEETYCLVEGISGSVHDTCGVTQSALTLFGNTTFGITRVECFKLESRTTFIRNAVSAHCIDRILASLKHSQYFSLQWPVVVFWYLALTVFLLATDNGRNVRRYVISKVCPSCRINERRLDRIMQREMEHRARILSAATRSARLAEGRGRYLLRTNGMRWTAEAESTEYVLQTRVFNAKRELGRREEAKLLKARNERIGDENEEDDDSSLHPSTPKKNSTKKDCSTPETVASRDDDEADEYAESEEDAPSSKKSEEITTDDNEVDTCTPVEEKEDAPEDDDESFDCTICLAPVEDGEKVGVLPCSHIFHAECLSHWVKRRNVCPLCQAREIATPRTIEEASTGNDGEEAVEISRPSNTSSPRSNATDVSGNMQSSTPSAQNRSRTTRPSQRLQLHSHSRQRRRNDNNFFIYSP